MRSRHAGLARQDVAVSYGSLALDQIAMGHSALVALQQAKLYTTCPSKWS